MNKDAYKSALKMLTRREHSCFELRQKLLKQDYLHDEIDEVLEALKQAGFQSDRRYVEMLIRARQNQGYGPVRIQHELSEKGVDSTLYSDLIIEDDEVWSELAREVREKKYGAESPEDFKAQAKQMKFLQYRGFSMRHISNAMKEKI